MTAAYWHCLTPGRPERGTTAGTESGADVKHGKATGHGTTSTTRVWGEQS